MQLSSAGASSDVPSRHREWRRICAPVLSASRFKKLYTTIFRNIKQLLADDAGQVMDKEEAEARAKKVSARGYLSCSETQGDDGRCYEIYKVYGFRSS